WQQPSERGSPPTGLLQPPDTWSVRWKHCVSTRLEGNAEPSHPSIQTPDAVPVGWYNYRQPMFPGSTFRLPSMKNQRPLSGNSFIVSPACVRGRKRLLPSSFLFDIRHLSFTTHSSSS